MASHNPYKKRGSLQYWIAERYLSGQSIERVKSDGLEIVEDQSDSRFIFGANVGGGRVPKPMPVQRTEYLRTVDRTWRDLLGRGITPRGEEKDDFDKRPGQGMGDYHDQSEGQDGNDGESDGESGEQPEGQGQGQEGDGEGQGEGQETESENGQGGESGAESEGQGQDKGEGQGQGDESEGEGQGQGEGEGEGQGAPPPPPKSKDKDWRWYEKEIRRLSKFLRERSESGDFIDDFGMRPLIDGARMYRAGIPARGLLHAATLSWAQETREEARVESWDPLEICEDMTGPNGERLHPLASYVVRLAKARVNIMLVGPKGSGKSHLAVDVARALTASNGRVYPYGETPMTAGASPSWLIGGETMSGYKSRPFCDIYEGGGVFSFEEIDAADPNMTIVVNNALAGDHFFNPASGRAIYRSPDFVAIATANTYGMGANREYTGRERLDAAFLDRFRMGRVFVNVDLDLGESIARAIIDKPAPAPVDPRAQEIADLEARLTALRG